MAQTAGGCRLVTATLQRCAAPGHTEFGGLRRILTSNLPRPGVPWKTNQQGPRGKACEQDGARKRTSQPSKEAERAWNTSCTPNATTSSRFVTAPLGRPCTSYREATARKGTVARCRADGSHRGAPALSVAIGDLATDDTGGTGRSPGPHPHRIYRAHRGPCRCGP